MNDIDRAKQYILDHGWTKDDYEDPTTGSVCMLGAFQKIYGTEDDLKTSDRVGQLLRGILRSEYPERGNGEIYMFNDHKDTTLDDVLAVMEKASAKFEEQVQ